MSHLLNVSLGSVVNWIDAGELKAGRTPGGHRRVAADDLLYFLRRHGLPVPAALDPSAPRILVVDDEEPVARWIAEEIRCAHPDYEVQVAHDGFSAGDLVGSWKPDVVFLDLRMPGMDGFEVCRRIKAKPETERARVIAVEKLRVSTSRAAGLRKEKWGKHEIEILFTCSTQMRNVRRAASVPRAWRSL